MSSALNVSIIQTNLSWENKGVNLMAFESKLKEIKNADLIILPEMFTTGFTMNTSLAEKMNGETVKWMIKQANLTKSVIAGSIIIEENKKIYNRFLFCNKNGVIDFYDKRHLFRMADENKFYSAGNKRVIIDIKGWKVCPQVCYDLRFPVWSRNLNDYDCLIYTANWPEVRNSAWKSLLNARAIENYCYVIGVNRIGADGLNKNYSGDSALIDFKGDYLYKSTPHKEEIIWCSLNKENLNTYKKKFPIQLDADEFKLTS